jgi:hypothetical protein
MVVWGGTTGTISDSLWVLRMTGGTGAWQGIAQSVNRPAPRFSHAASYDGSGGRMLLFGGDKSGTRANDLWSLDLRNLDVSGGQWTALGPGRAVPPPGARGSMVLFPGTRELYLFGGNGGGTNGASPLRSRFWSFASDTLACLDVPVGHLSLAPARVRVWPNPARGAFSVGFDLAEEGLVTIELYDVRGRRLHAAEPRRFTAGTHSQTLRLDAAARLASGGLVFVRVRTPDGASAGRVVVVQ